MQDFVARVNIERFLRLISEEPDPAIRDRLERMLVEEQAKLRIYETHPGSHSQDQVTGEPSADR